ncbi:hypothetical protein N9R81_01790 [Flavobacteriales bacterium]|nr:hypothetical protein [Flavobacteriales bacterium]
MKKYFLSTIMFAVYLTSFGQYKITVTEKSANLGGASHNAFSVMVFEMDAKDVEKAWKKEMKKMGAKVQSKKEMFGDDANTSEMGDNNFDIYAIAKEEEKGVELTAAFDLGGAYLSSGEHAAQAKYIKDLMYKFGVDATKLGIQGIIKAEEKTQKDLENDQKNLEKDKEKLEKNIEEWEKSIEQAKKDIEQNIKDQEEKKKAIEAQIKVVEEVVAKEKSVK